MIFICTHVSSVILGLVQLIDFIKCFELQYPPDGFFPFDEYSLLIRFGLESILLNTK